MSWQGCSLSGDEQVIGHDRHKGELLTGSLTCSRHSETGPVVEWQVIAQNGSEPHAGSGRLNCRFPERDQLALFLIPQGKHHGPKCLGNSEAVDMAELGKVSQHVRQTVEWNPAHKMVDVVDADVSSEPAQRLCLLEVGTPAQRRLVE
jgi:hypothetical protein